MLMIRVIEAASVNEFSERVANMRSIEVLRNTTARDPRYKNLTCLSDDAKEQTRLRIGQQIACDDWLKTNVHDDTDSDNKTICEHNPNGLKLMESVAYSEVGVRRSSDEVQQSKMGEKLLNQLIHCNGKNSRIIVSFSRTQNIGTAEN